MPTLIFTLLPPFYPRLAATAPRVPRGTGKTVYQSLVSAATSIAAYQIAQRHISPVIVTALTLQGIQCIP